MRHRLKTLLSRHEIIDAKIERAQTRPSRDDLKISAMKKIRLRLRDEINALERAFDAGKRQGRTA